MNTTKPKIIQASFFWRNNMPGGIGINFGPPIKPAELEHMFLGEVAKKFKHESDKALGTKVVSDYMAQLSGIGRMAATGQPLPTRVALLAALNILWLTDRGFMPQDEFNGYIFVGQGERK